MRTKLNCIGLSAAALLAALAAVDGAQASPIAEVTNLVNSAFRSPPGADEIPVAVSDQLVQDEAVRTEAESTVDLNFIDGSQMSLEPESELILSKYVFDPEGGKKAEAVIDLQSGTFHYTSNGAPDQNIVLKTPVATIGIRGTELLIHVGPTMALPGNVGLTVDVIDGAVDVQPGGTGKGASAKGGQSVSVKGANSDASVGDIGDVSTAAAASPDKEKDHEKDASRDRKSAGKPGGGEGGDARPGV